jgi:hypothetical protein
MTRREDFLRVVASRALVSKINNNLLHINRLDSFILTAEHNSPPNMASHYVLGLPIYMPPNEERSTKPRGKVVAPLSGSSRAAHDSLSPSVFPERRTFLGFFHPLRPALISTKHFSVVARHNRFSFIVERRREPDGFARKSTQTESARDTLQVIERKLTSASNFVVTT